MADLSRTALDSPTLVAAARRDSAQRTRAPIVERPLPFLGGDLHLPAQLGAEDLVLHLEVLDLPYEVSPAGGDEEDVQRVEAVEHPAMVSP